ncbi:hypothetical protein OROGR_023966 [Orobanche gracilis]
MDSSRRGQSNGILKTEFRTPSENSKFSAPSPDEPVSDTTCWKRKDCHIFWQNLKMTISHPRFLNVAARYVMNSEFPSCLRKQENASQSCMQVGTIEAVDHVFVFPQVNHLCLHYITSAVSSIKCLESILIFSFLHNTTSSWETPHKWPLWFRAAAAGSISLYVTIYYEIEDGLSVIKYRTLRMHYNLEVLPSLEVSLQTSPRPSRLQEFLVWVNVVNRISSESFRIHQLSCVGDQWELAVLRPTDYVFSSELLMAGQALSCFFKLKYRRRQGRPEKNISSLAM